MTTLLPITTVIATIAPAVVGCRTGSQAPPPAFPDLGSLAPVNVADYSIATANPERGSSSRVYFLTAGGNACVIDPGAAECTGNNFPGVPAPPTVME
jgi:hypothetical protein